jgi:hypothetical protein
MEYKLIRSALSDEIIQVHKIVEIEDGVSITMSIPLVEANKDYQEYLEWLAEGNTPEEVAD